MTNKEDTLRSKLLTADLMWAGVELGCETSLKLSALYAIVGLLVIELLRHGEGFRDLLDVEASHWWSNFAFIMVATVIGILVLAIAPAITLGTLTGMFLGGLAAITKRRISKYFFVAFCILSCTAMAILIHLFLKIPVTLSFQNPSANGMAIYLTYPFHVGVPSIIYILAGGWIGSQLYSKTPIEA